MKSPLVIFCCCFLSLISCLIINFPASNFIPSPGSILPVAIDTEGQTLIGFSLTFNGVEVASLPSVCGVQALIGLVPHFSGTLRIEACGTKVSNSEVCGATSEIRETGEKIVASLVLGEQTPLQSFVTLQARVSRFCPCGGDSCSSSSSSSSDWECEEKKSQSEEMGCQTKRESNNREIANVYQTVHEGEYAWKQSKIKAKGNLVLKGRKKGQCKDKKKSCCKDCEQKNPCKNTCRDPCNQKREHCDENPGLNCVIPLDTVSFSMLIQLPPGFFGALSDFSLRIVGNGTDLLIYTLPAVITQRSGNVFLTTWSVPCLYNCFGKARAVLTWTVSDREGIRTEMCSTLDFCIGKNPICRRRRKEKCGC